jgi:hypothetical protein
MPPSEINQLTDIELVEAAGAASQERTQRRIQAEMWRRTTLDGWRTDHRNVIQLQRHRQQRHGRWRRRGGECRGH